MGRIYSVYFMQESPATANFMSSTTDYNCTPLHTTISTPTYH